MISNKITDITNIQSIVFVSYKNTYDKILHYHKNIVKSLYLFTLYKYMH